MRFGSVAGRHHAGALDHENDGALRGARAVHDPLRHREALPRPELDGPPFEIDDPSPLDHVEELVLMVVLVPVEFSLHHTEAHNAVVHATERLVVPTVSATLDELLDGDEL